VYAILGWYQIVLRTRQFASVLCDVYSVSCVERTCVPICGVHVYSLDVWSSSQEVASTYQLCETYHNNYGISVSCALVITDIRISSSLTVAVQCVLRLRLFQPTFSQLTCSGEIYCIQTMWRSFHSWHHNVVNALYGNMSSLFWLIFSVSGS
jgi:hypothetical protein